MCHLESQQLARRGWSFRCTMRPQIWLTLQQLHLLLVRRFDISEIHILNTLQSSSQVPLEGWLQVLLVAGLIETQLFKEPVRPVLTFFALVSPCFPCLHTSRFAQFDFFDFLRSDYYVCCSDFCFTVAFASIFSFY